MKGYLRPFQRIFRLYRESNLRRVEVKDDCPFRHTLAGFEPTLAIGLRFRGRRHAPNEKHFILMYTQRVQDVFIQNL